MKIGRNDPCPCGSGNKYKRCCMDAISKQHAEIFDDIAQTVAMSPGLNLEELNIVAQRKMADYNNRPRKELCGLSSTQMANWLYAPFDELEWVKIQTPEDLSASPVMRYLNLILEQAMAQGGSIKATAKGNLPAKLVKQASELLPEFAVAQYEKIPSISEFTGSNEDKFNALHYTRLLAQIAGILYLRSGRIHVKKTAQKQFQIHGISVFFLPMLEAAVKQFNWGYLDTWPEFLDLRLFWLFMLWRIQVHGSVDQLMDEMHTAVPDLVQQLPDHKYLSKAKQFSAIIECRFVDRFLQFWGFVIVDPRRYIDEKRVPIKATLLPLFEQSFSFEV